jgi:hypothetical protein
LCFSAVSLVLLLPSPFQFHSSVIRPLEATYNPVTVSVVKQASKKVGQFASGISIKIFCAFIVFSIYAICSAQRILFYLTIVILFDVVHLVKLFIIQFSSVSYNFLSPASENSSQLFSSNTLSLHVLVLRVGA